MLRLLNHFVLLILSVLILVVPVTALLFCALWELITAKTRALREWWIGEET